MIAWSTANGRSRVSRLASPWLWENRKVQSVPANACESFARMIYPLPLTLLVHSFLLRPIQSITKKINFRISITQIAFVASETISTPDSIRTRLLQIFTAPSRYPLTSAVDH